MTHAPIELLIVDTLNIAFLVLGAIYLMKFLLMIGSKKSKKYSIILCISIIAYALVHELMEVIHNLFAFEVGYAETAITTAISIAYLVAAIRIRNELNSIIFSEVRKHDK